MQRLIPLSTPTLVAVAFIFGLTGCGRKAAPPAKDAVFELRDRLSVTRRQDGTPVSGGSYSPHFEAVRNGIRRDSILLMPPVTVSAPLNGLPACATLRGIAAPVYNIGDGMQLDIVLIGEGNERTVYSRYYDAGRRAEDRRWVPFTAPLDLPVGQNFSLELRVTPGAQGDLVADWLAVSDLQVVQRTS